MPSLEFDRGCIRSWLLLAACWMVVALLTPRELSANNQSGTKQNSSDSSRRSATSPLVEGLLELLDPPKAGPQRSADPTTSDGEPTGPKSAGPVPQLRPEDVGLGGEDLGQPSENALEAVRQSMLIAAGYLDRGVTHQSTQQLQSDIVQRLDDFIDQLEQANRSQSNRPQTSSNSSVTSSESLSAVTSSTTNTKDTESASEPQSTESLQGGPTGTGPARSAAVKLGDPRALQRSVWGHLPDQVRKQMQSKMVERFLPSYRQQIEDYFQALLTESLQ